MPALAKAPDIVLNDFDGRGRNVNEFIGQGKWTVVAIWAYDCPICNAEVHHLAFSTRTIVRRTSRSWA